MIPCSVRFLRILPCVQQHAPDAPLMNTLLGNPGPQPRFNPREPAFSAVVRYFSIIE